MMMGMKKFENGEILIHSWITFTVGNVDRYIECYIGGHSSRHLIDTRLPLGRLSIDTRLRLGRYSVDSRSRCMSADIAFQVADTLPTLGRYLTDTRHNRHKRKDYHVHSST